MGSYDYSDFITGLPVSADSDKTYVVIVTKRDTWRTHKPTINYINDLYEPVTFPLFAKYYGYGKFELDDQFDKLNQVALNYHAEELLVDGKLDILELAENDYSMSATLYSVYDKAVFKSNMAYKPKWRGGIESIETHKEVFDQRMNDFEEWANRVESKMEGLREDDHSERMQLLLQEEVSAIVLPELHHILNHDTRLSLFEIKKQLKLLKEMQEDEDVYIYLLGWFCFYHYLEYIRKPFLPALSSLTHLTIKDFRKQKELELEALIELEEEYDKKKREEN